MPIDKDLLDILACPKCKGNLILLKKGLKCKKCKYTYKINKDNIPIMLIEEEKKDGNN